MTILLIFLGVAFLLAGFEAAMASMSSRGKLLGLALSILGLILSFIGGKIL